MAKKTYDVFYGPGYTAILRPTPDDRSPRSRSDANRVLDSNQFPDVNAYLASKKSGIADWARTEFDPKIAAHMIRFLRTGSLRDLSTLTELEIILLREKYEDVRQSLIKKTPASH